MRLTVMTIPMASVLLLALLGVAPWGLGEGPGFALPALPFIAIHYWSGRHPGLVPAPLVFLTGLGVDVLSHGPLGYWSLVYLGGIALTQLQRLLLDPVDGVAHGLGFCGVAAVLMGLAWLLASAYFARLVDWWPMAIAALLLPIAHLAIVPLLVPLARVVVGRPALNLDRGG